MSIVLHGLGDFAVAYLDDIIIFRASEEECKQHIQKNFDCLGQLNLKLSKCKFMQKETQYLGFIISEEGIMADPEKVRVMRHAVTYMCKRGKKFHILYVDVCNDFIGACLCQEQHTHGGMKSNEPNEKHVHYLSCKLAASQTNRPTIEKDAFVLFYTVQKLNEHLPNSEFVIRKDHKPLKYSMDSQV